MPTNALVSRAKMVGSALISRMDMNASAEEDLQEKLASSVRFDNLTIFSTATIRVE